MKKLVLIIVTCTVFLGYIGMSIAQTSYEKSVSKHQVALDLASK